MPAAQAVAHRGAGHGTGNDGRRQQAVASAGQEGRRGARASAASPALRARRGARRAARAARTSRPRGAAARASGPAWRPRRGARRRARARARRAPRRWRWSAPAWWRRCGEAAPWRERRGICSSSSSPLAAPTTKRVPWSRRTPRSRPFVCCRADQQARARFLRGVVPIDDVPAQQGSKKLSAAQHALAHAGTRGRRQRTAQSPQARRPLHPGAARARAIRSHLRAQTSPRRCPARKNGAPSCQCRRRRGRARPRAPHTRACRTPHTPPRRAVGRPSAHARPRLRSRTRFFTTPEHSSTRRGGPFPPSHAHPR
jgi:hypothetical protein